MCPKEGQELAASCPAQFPPHPAPPGTLYLEPWLAPSLRPCSPLDPGIALLPAEILLSQPAMGLEGWGRGAPSLLSISCQGGGRGDTPVTGLVADRWACGEDPFWGCQVLHFLPQGIALLVGMQGMGVIPPCAPSSQRTCSHWEPQGTHQALGELGGLELEQGSISRYPLDGLRAGGSREGAGTHHHLPLC